MVQTHWPEALANWAAAVLAAKIFAGVIRREFGVAPSVVAWRRSGLTVDVAYVLLLAALSVVVQWVGVSQSLYIAITLRLGILLSTRILLAANHYFVELFAMVLCLRLADTPLALAAAIQMLVVSLWAYSAFQKLYHREFLDGSFFYITFQDRRTARWPGMASRVGRIDGYHAPVDSAGLTLCHRLAVATIVTEFAVPIFALSLSGTWWSVAVLALAAGAIGYMSGETSFMITNLVLASFFLLGFDAGSLLLGLQDPIAGLILAFTLIWPAVHAVTTRRLRISSWKLCGWGMYATIQPAVSVVEPAGVLVPQTTGSAPLGLLESYGASKTVWLSRYARRVFLRWYPDAARVRGFAFSWVRRREDVFVTHCAVIPIVEGVPQGSFVLQDETSVMAFQAYAASLPDSVSGVTTFARHSPSSATGVSASQVQMR